MTIITFIQAICLMPIFYNKFHTEAASQATMRYRCEREMKLCYEFSSDIRMCFDTLKEF
jgi:hypothetical protein